MQSCLIAGTAFSTRTVERGLLIGGSARPSNRSPVTGREGWPRVDWKLRAGSSHRRFRGPGGVKDPSTTVAQKTLCARSSVIGCAVRCVWQRIAGGDWDQGLPACWPGPFPGAPPRIFPRCAGRCPVSTMITSRPSLRPDLDLLEPTRMSQPDRLEERDGMARVNRELEPPERAALAREGPEVKTQRPLEAPDAGVGGFDRNDREFSHGRSRG
jgi:hypothetical protein